MDYGFYSPSNSKKMLILWTLDGIFLLVVWSSSLIPCVMDPQKSGDNRCWDRVLWKRFRRWSGATSCNTVNVWLASKLEQRKKTPIIQPKLIGTSEDQGVLEVMIWSTHYGGLNQQHWHKHLVAHEICNIPAEFLHKLRVNVLKRTDSPLKTKGKLTKYHFLCIMHL